jgi:hypothetical protein
MPRRIDPAIGRAAVERATVQRAAVERAAVQRAAVERATTEGPVAEVPDRDTIATAVRYLLQELADRAPGRSVEVRVPPFGAAQCIDGTSHRRGTPPAVIEMDARTWIALGAGTATWADAVESGQVQASGERADLSHLLPLVDPVSADRPITAP